MMRKDASPARLLAYESIKKRVVGEADSTFFIFWSLEMSETKVIVFNISDVRFL